MGSRELPVLKSGHFVRTSVCVQDQEVYYISLDTIILHENSDG